MKYCKDCKHCRPTSLFGFKSYTFARCTQPTSFNTLLNGNVAVAPSMEGAYCSTLRSSLHNDACGPAGKHWEAK